MLCEASRTESILYVLDRIYDRRGKAHTLPMTNSMTADVIKKDSLVLTR